MTTFEVGETVRLRSGSQPMTVRYHVTDEDVAVNAQRSIGVTCDWHGRKGRPFSATYAPEQLVKVELAAKLSDKTR